MKNNKYLILKMSMRLFKCHLIMLLVAIIFTFFFGGFLNIDKPINGYIYTTVVVVGYAFFLYSESLIEARKNFYNVNGRREELDLLFGFRCGAAAHLPTFLLLLITLIFYYTGSQVYLYLNLAFRFWMLPFLSYFPSDDSIHLWLYLLFTIFPCIVVGISYLLGIRECKNINDV